MHESSAVFCAVLYIRHRRKSCLLNYLCVSGPLVHELQGIVGAPRVKELDDMHDVLEAIERPKNDVMLIFDHERQGEPWVRRTLLFKAFRLVLRGDFFFGGGMSVNSRDGGFRDGSRALTI